LSVAFTWRRGTSVTWGGTGEWRGAGVAWRGTGVARGKRRPESAAERRGPGGV